MDLAQVKMTNGLVSRGLDALAKASDQQKQLRKPFSVARTPRKLSVVDEKVGREIAALLAALWVGESAYLQNQMLDEHQIQIAEQLRRYPVLFTKAGFRG